MHQRGGRLWRWREFRRCSSRCLRLTSASGPRSSWFCSLTCTWWITSVWCTFSTKFFRSEITSPRSHEVPVLLDQVEAELEEDGGKDQDVDAVVWWGDKVTNIHLNRQIEQDFTTQNNHNYKRIWKAFHKCLNDEALNTMQEVKGLWWPGDPGESWSMMFSPPKRRAKEPLVRSGTRSRLIWKEQQIQLVNLL